MNANVAVKVTKVWWLLRLILLSRFLTANPNFISFVEKFILVLWIQPCVLKGNCWTEDDAKYLDWRALKQVRCFSWDKIPILKITFWAPVIDTPAQYLIHLHGSILTQIEPSQETFGLSVDQQMESQFKKMQLFLENAAKACEEGFGEDKESAEACTAKVPPVRLIPGAHGV